ncbi:fluoride efflux transporter FluC [Virgibacillus sp. W0430]|uniref:fluoride efflux transporter FluC n=1 Tax=Virgibacillus sp. W0430 TaxID=3391580 RepID=UPI003F46925D
MPKRFIGSSGKYYAAIGAGGIIGSLLRYSVSLLFEERYSYFPVATLFVNVTGCFLLGFLFNNKRIKKEQASNLFYRFITVGIIGSFTTFSTVTIETFELWSQNIVLAMCYVFISIFGGLGMAYVGSMCGKKSRV